MLDWFTLKDLAKCGYYSYNEVPEEWRQLGKPYINEQTGFVGKAFIDTKGEIVISFSGTDIFESYRQPDLRNDLNMAVGNLPAQAQNAMEFYNNIKLQYPNAKITLTGHSLGGSLAQIVAKLTGEIGVAFNPFSTGDSGREYPNITNIISSEDFISMSDINTQPGNIFVIPNESDNIIMPKFNLFSPAHKLENMNLIEAKRYKKGTIKSFMDKMNEGENHQRLKHLQQFTKKNLDAWETAKKSPLGRNITKENVNGKYYYLKNNQYDNSNKSILYGGISKDMHWVTIKGEHVLLPVED